MQIIYAAPFILLSAICSFACLVIPKMRPYLLQATVAPVAFGFCSIIGEGAVMVISDYWLHLTVLDAPPSGISAVIVALAIYVTPGVLGTWLAVSFARRLRTRISK